MVANCGIQINARLESFIVTIYFLRNTVLDVEVACLDISPLGEGAVSSDLVAVGLWTDISARILRLPDLSEATKENLGGGEFKDKFYSYYVKTLNTVSIWAYRPWFIGASSAFSKCFILNSGEYL